MNTFTESVVEEATLAWLPDLGYVTLLGPSIAPGESADAKATTKVFVEARLRDTLLPKLITSELPVVVAQRWIEESS